MAKYKISRKMMHKQLRFKGSLVRRILPHYRPSTFRYFNKFFRVFVVKKEKNVNEINIRSVYIDRCEDEAKDKLRLCVFSPEKNGRFDKSGETLPCFLWFHGGGFGQGVPEAELPYVKVFMETYPCVVVAPAYRLSTEAKYPAAVNDCYDALMYVKNNAESLGVNKKQIFVGGDSAGGGLACAVTIMARNRKTVNVAFQMPLYPMLDDRMITESSRNNDSPMWNTKSNECAWKLYLGDLYQSEDLSCYASPARLNDFAGLPPMMTYIGSLDVFLDETLNYIKNLQNAGIEAKIKVLEGCFHGFEGLHRKSEPALEAEQFVRESFAYAVENYFKEN